jgi:hypothetical protein
MLVGIEAPIGHIYFMLVGVVRFSSGGLYTLHDVWEKPPANNLPQTPHSAGAYDTGYVRCSQVLHFGARATISS